MTKTYTSRRGAVFSLACVHVYFNPSAEISLLLIFSQKEKVTKLQSFLLARDEGKIWVACFSR